MVDVIFNFSFEYKINDLLNKGLLTNVLKSVDFCQIFLCATDSNAFALFLYLFTQFVFYYTRSSFGEEVISQYLCILWNRNLHQTYPLTKKKLITSSILSRDLITIYKPETKRRPDFVSHVSHALLILKFSRHVGVTHKSQQWRYHCGDTHYQPKRKMQYWLKTFWI